MCGRDAGAGRDVMSEADDLDSVYSASLAGDNEETGFFAY